MSHGILSEQEELLVLRARRSLISEINANGFYAIICDESSDRSKIEQVSFSVGHCTEVYEISEDFPFSKLAMLMKNRVSKHALYVHCFAHCNELVFKDASSLSSVISDGQDFCENIHVLAGVSPKRVLLFQNVEKEMPEVPGSVGDCNINDNNSSYDSKGNVTLKLKIFPGHGGQQEVQQLML